MTEATELAPIAGKLSKLLRLLLSSDRDGEILAAAKAMARTLESVNLDHHDFAEAIEAAARKRFSEEDVREIYRRGIAKGRQEEQNARPHTFHKALAAGCYVEATVSGSGIRVIGKSPGPEIHRRWAVNGRNGAGIEVYRNTARYTNRPKF